MFWCVGLFVMWQTAWAGKYQQNAYSVRFADKEHLSTWRRSSELWSVFVCRGSFSINSNIYITSPLVHWCSNSHHSFFSAILSKLKTDTKKHIKSKILYNWLLLCAHPLSSIPFFPPVYISLYLIYFNLIPALFAVYQSNHLCPPSNL